MILPLSEEEADDLRYFLSTKIGDETEPNNGILWNIHDRLDEEIKSADDLEVDELDSEPIVTVGTYILDPSHKWHFAEVTP